MSKPLGGVKASESQVQEALRQFKEAYYKDIKEYNGDLLKVLEDYPPWNIYEDIKNKNPFRVISIDELERKDGTYILALYGVKATPQGIEEIVGIDPSILRKVDGWNVEQKSIIDKCSCPDGFNNEMGFLLLHQIIVEHYKKREAAEKSQKSNQENTQESVQENIQ